VEHLVASLIGLRSALGDLDVSLPLADTVDTQRVLAELVGQIDDYLLPRLARMDAPLLVVLGGSTGAGKSTITNSLVGDVVSLAGVLRPSTRTPVLVCNAADSEWFLRGDLSAATGVEADAASLVDSGTILPGLARSTGDRPVGSGLHVVQHDRVPRGLALLDAPDIDSVETANHELAAQLLGAADVWLFVTTASRYADAVPWDYLRRARDRAVALAVVVNRIPTGAADDVLVHLAEMLDEQGLGAIRLFPIEETGGDAEGRLELSDVSDLQEWLTGLVADDAHRDEVVWTTLEGTLDSIPARVTSIAAGVEAQVAAIDALRLVAVDRYHDALGALDDELSNGVLLRGEVLDLWREHVGTSAFMDRLQQGVGRLRSRLRQLVTRTPVPVEAAQDQLESNLSTLVTNHADRAALGTVTEWEASTAGATVLATAERGIDRPTPGLAARLDRELDEWHDEVLTLVQTRSGSKLAVARALSLGLNGVGVALMIAVFSQTGGFTGAEAGVAAGTAAVSQTLLTAIFGENAVRDLVRDARYSLQLRLAGLFEVERSRFDALLGPHSSHDQLDVLLGAHEQLVAASSERRR